MRSASSGETKRQRRIFSVAIFFLLAGRNTQIKFAKPRPIAKQNFSGKRQISQLNSFKHLYSMRCHRPLSSKVVTKVKLLDRIIQAIMKIIYVPIIVEFKLLDEVIQIRAELRRPVNVQMCVIIKVRIRETL